VSGGQPVEVTLEPRGTAQDKHPGLACAEVAHRVRHAGGRPREVSGPADDRVIADAEGHLAAQHVETFAVPWMQVQRRAGVTYGKDHLDQGKVPVGVATAQMNRNRPVSIRRWSVREALVHGFSFLTIRAG